MLNSTTGTPTPKLDTRAREIAEQLRGSLAKIVERVIGPSIRPAALSRALQIDRTLSARVLRAIRATDSVQVLHETPAPGGLRIFLDAAEAAGVPEAIRRPAAENIKSFERLIDEFPGGRTALDAALAGLDEGVHKRNIRGATQAIHKSMASLLGYQADTHLATIIMQPAADGKSADQVYLLGKYGIRRLRASSPITVFGRSGDLAEIDPTNPRQIRVQTLDGRSDPENGNAYLLAEFCTQPVPPLSLFRTDRAYLYTLSENVPPVNTPVSLVAGMMVRGGGLLHATENNHHQWESQVPRMPSKVLLNDVFIHDDLYPGVEPVVTSSLHTIASGSRRPDAPAFKLDNVDVTPPLVSLGHGLSNTATRDVPHYTEMLRSTFAKAGWDPSKFRGYRCRVQYPVPLVSLTFWFELPGDPRQAGK